MSSGDPQPNTSAGAPDYSSVPFGPADGGPAFPFATGYERRKEWHPGHGEFVATQPVAAYGLSVRDYFAAAALTGLLACMRPEDRFNRIRREESTTSAFELADLMLEKRGKQ